MRILVNASNLRIGGGVQKAVEFIRSSLSYDSGHAFCYVVSDVVARNLETLVETRGLDLTVASVSPALPWGGRATRRMLVGLEKRFRPDVVFSIFGPTYHAFRSPHVMGFAVPWVTHPNPHAWRTLRNPIARARHWAWCRQVAFWTRFADRWVLETRVAAEGLTRALGADPARFHVVPNNCAEQYYQARDAGVRPDARLRRESDSDFHLLVFSAWYPHKNLEIVPRVAAALRQRDPGRIYRFFLTFDRASRPWRSIETTARRLGVERNVVNLGPVPVRDGPGLYFSSDALFLPTLLESYTATYPEAMCMRRPIVTCDLPFARDICGEAALYVPPNDARATADRIADLAGNDALRAELVARGDRTLAGSKTPRELYDMFLEILAHAAGGRRPHPASRSVPRSGS